MAYLDSADIVRRIKIRLNRPTTDQAFTVTSTDDVLYDFATEAQDRIVKLLATFAPDAMWTVPTAMVTSDSGATFTVGTDVDSATIFAIGHYKVYAQRSNIPDNPLIPGIEFTVEGSLIRMPNNTTRVFSDGATPWIQYVAPSNVVASGSQPTLPKIARMAMISDASRRCAERLDQDSGKHEAQFQSDWIEVLSAIKTQANGKGASYSGRMRTFSTGDLSWWPGGRPY
jgi:hypothetical protein